MANVYESDSDYEYEYLGEEYDIRDRRDAYASSLLKGKGLQGRIDPLDFDYDDDEDDYWDDSFRY